MNKKVTYALLATALVVALAGSGLTFDMSCLVNTFNGRSGAVTPQAGDYSAGDVGLGNVTNDAQVKASDATAAPAADKIPIFDSNGNFQYKGAYSSGVIDNGTTHAPTYGTAENPTIDWTKGSIQKITSSSTGSATPTVAFTAPTGPASVLLKITHEATTTAITYTWPNTVKWSAGVAPVTTNTSGAVDVISFFYDGSTYYGTTGLDLR